jgi:hypothetical protein
MHRVDIVNPARDAKDKVKQKPDRAEPGSNHRPAFATGKGAGRGRPQSTVDDGFE